VHALTVRSFDPISYRFLTRTAASDQITLAFALYLAAFVAICAMRRNIYRHRQAQSSRDPAEASGDTFHVFFNCRPSRANANRDEGGVQFLK
jgi:hypothetical protein